MHGLAHADVLAPDNQLHGHVAVGAHAELHPDKHVGVADDRARQADGVASRVGRDDVGAVADGHAHEFDQLLDGLLDALALAEGVLVGDLLLLPERLPLLGKVGRRGGPDVVGWRALEVLELVLVVEALLLRLPGARVDLLDLELEDGGDGADGRALDRPPEDDVGLPGAVVGSNGQGNRRLFLEIGRVGQVEHDANLLDDLLGDRVGDVELEHVVGREDVVHAEHVVLRLLLGELHGGTRLEHGPESGNLRHGLELLGVLGEPVLLRRHRLTLHHGGREPVRLVRGSVLALRRRLGHRREIERLARVSRLEVLVQARHQVLGRVAPLWRDQRPRGRPVAAGGIGATELRQVQGGPVPHLIVRVEQCPLEQHDDPVAQPLALQSEAREGRQRGRPHRGILQNDTVVDHANVPGRVLRLGPLLAQQMQNFDAQERELAVLDELRQLAQRDVLGLWHVLDDGQDGIHDRLFVRETTVLPQTHAQEVQHPPVLGGELDAQRPDRLDHHDLELVRQLADEVPDLLHQPVDRPLVARLEQRGDRQRGDRPVAVGDQRLHLDIAVGHQRRMRHGHLVQRPNGREPHRRLGRRQEQLQHRDGRRQLPRRHVLEVDDRPRRLEDDNLAAMTEARLQVVIERARGPAGPRRRVGNHLRHVPHQQQLRVRRPHVALGQLCHQLGDRESILATQRMLQRHRMELHHRVPARQRLLNLAVPPLDHLWVLVGQLQRARQHRRGHHRTLVHDRLLQVPLNLQKHLSVDDLAQHPDRIRPEQIVRVVHVLHQRARDDDHFLRGRNKLLDAQVDHPTQVKVLVHEQLGHAEKHV